MSKKLLYVMLIVLVCSNQLLAQKKQVKRAPGKPVKKTTIPSPPRIEPVLIDGNSQQDPGFAPMPVPEPPSRSESAADAVDNARPAREKKQYNKPFQFWPGTDTVINMDYKDYLAQKRSRLKNCGTGNTPAGKHPVKAISELCYEVSRDKKDTVRYYGDGWNERTEYDRLGNITNLYVIFEDDKTKRDSAYLTTKYWYEGAQLKLKEYYWWASGRKEAEEELEYDAQGRLWKVYYTPLDADGKAITDEGRGFSTLYRYEQDQKITEDYERLDDAGKMLVLKKTHYEKLGMDGKVLQKKSVTWPEEKPDHIDKYRYNAKGQEIYAGNGSEYNEYEYDGTGQKVKTIIVRDGLKSTTIYRYTYDKQGNWITKTETESSPQLVDGPEKTYLWKRLIEYY